MVVEQEFGIIVNGFETVRSPLRVHLEKVTRIIIVGAKL